MKRILSNRFVSNTVAYAGLTVVNRGIPFLLMPILTRYLDPEAFGIITMFLTLQVGAMVVVGLSLSSVMMQRYFKMVPDEFPRFLIAAYSLVCAAATLLSLGLVMGSEWLIRLTNLPVGWLLAANLSAVLGMIQAIGLTLLQMRQQASRYVTVQLVGSVANALLSIALVVQLEYGWQGRALGILLSLLMTVGWLLFTQIRDGDLSLTNAAAVRLSPDLWNTMSDLMRLGLPLVPGALLIWGTTMSDRFFINTLADSSALGIYAIGMMFAQVVDIIASTVNQAFMPIVFSKLNGSETDRRKLVQWTYALFASLLLIVIVWSAVAKQLLIVLIDPRYFGAVSLLTILAIGYGFNNAASLMSTFILNKEKNAMISVASLIPFVVSVSLSLVLIPEHGIVGAAYAFISAAALNFIAMFAIAYRADNLPWLSPFNDKTI